jgi:O-6-methylguanine DNA methyltransferase
VKKARSKRSAQSLKANAREQFCIFDTALGSVGIVWRDKGLRGLFLPDKSAERVRLSIIERHPDASEEKPPKAIRRTVSLVCAAFVGKRTNFADVELDLSDATAFRRRVYEAARQVDWGQTCSYGDLAQKLGVPGGARAVGGALGNNPIPLIVPCHRVLDSRGQIGGFTAPGGTKTKTRMLELEKVLLKAPASAPKRAPKSSGKKEHGAALVHLRRVDPELRKAIDRVGPFDQRLQKTSDVFAALGRAIVHQQLSGKAAETIWGRFVALFPQGPTASAVLRTPSPKLRAVGLSESKVKSVLDLARRIDDGSLPELPQLRRMNDESVIEVLTEVRGVGRWTAEMFLMFRLGRLDVLPLDDLGIKKGFAWVAGLNELPDKATMSERGQRWAPYRSVASYYLWRAAEFSD